MHSLHGYLKIFCPSLMLLYAYIIAYKKFRYNHLYKCIFSQARPTMTLNRPKSARQKMTFTPSVQHAINTQLMLQCCECDKWRLLYSKKKMKADAKKQVTELIESIDYTCGLMFGEQTVFFFFYLHRRVILLEIIHFFVIQCVQIKAPVFKPRLWTIGLIFFNNSKSM